MTCLIKLPELSFKFLQSFSYSVALCDRHTCNKQTCMSECRAPEKVYKDKLGWRLTLQMNSELNTHASLSHRVLKYDLCLCLFYGCERKRVWLRHYRCVYTDRGGKPNILTHKKTKSDRRGADQLVNQNLLGHSFYGPASVESVQPMVPVMHTGTQGGTHYKHATFRNKKRALTLIPVI